MYQILSSLNIEEARLDEETAQVFKLANRVELYQSRMQQLGVKLDTRVDSTWLKQRLIAQFPDMRAYTKARYTSYWYLKKASGLLSPKPVSWTVILMWSILNVLHIPPHVWRRRALQQITWRMPRRLCAITVTWPCEHGPRGSQH